MSSLSRTLPNLLIENRPRHAHRVALRRRSSRGGGQVTYDALLNTATEIAAGLMAVGLAKGDRVGVIADNDASWLELDLGIHMAGGVSVPRGADTAPIEMEYILGHSEARLAFVQKDDAAAYLQTRRADLPALERLLRTHDACDDSLTALRRLGAERLHSRPHCVTERLDQSSTDDLATIVYTSGTTADPKGVMLSHGNLLHNLDTVPQILELSENDVFLSLLPSWHMFERILEYVCLAQGAQLVYTDPRRLKEDLQAVRPTLMAAVPRIWEVLYRGILASIDGANSVKRNILSVCLELCTRSARGEASAVESALHRVLCKTLLAPFQHAVGGRLSVAVSGGGALPQPVDEFFLAIGIPLLNGYGLTETSPVVSVRLPRANCVGTIGPPLPLTEIQIRDEAGVVLGPDEIGLIWIRGPQVMQGYYKNPDATQRSIDAEGWFNSGDLGCRTRDGQIRITGRAKDTIVLLGGENVEPEPIESALKATPLIAQAVVLGQDQKQVGALLVADTSLLEAEIPRPQWDEADGILRGPRVRDLFRRELDRRVNRQGGFRPVDRVGPFRVLAQPFTREDGSLTPTLKVKRRIVTERFGRLIAEMFAEP